MNVYLVLSIQILVASATHIVAKSVVGDVDAVTLTFLRGVVSVVGLCGIVAVRGRWVHIARGDRWPLVFLGFLGTINQLLYLYGLRFTTAANAALLYASTPVFVLILSALMLGERMTLVRTIGILVAFFGVLIVIFERGVSLTSEYTIGNLIILVAVLAWALFTILGKRQVMTYGALQATVAASVAGTALLAPFGLFSTMASSVGSYTVTDWSGILYLGIGTSVVGYLLWYYALRRIDASRLAVFANGQPIVATILSVIFLGATISPQFLVGATITLAGVVVTQRKR